jgi:formylglycine-generating enzyme required for sulfatase activity
MRQVLLPLLAASIFVFAPARAQSTNGSQSGLELHGELRNSQTVVAKPVVNAIGSDTVRNLRPVGVAANKERRVALVIGNATYKQGPLRNPVNDANAMAGKLRSLGFDVILKENLKVGQVSGVYREFRQKIPPGGVALVFYAGHGVQFKGQNYFPAVDSEIQEEEGVPMQSLHLGTLLDVMEESKAGINLVFLDACRDNPFAKRFRSGARGLATVEKASGTLIHYATKPGSVAADGTGKNGTYTEALLAQIGEPGVPIEQVLKRVTNRVADKTNSVQEPWVEGSLRGDFYFIPPEPTSAIGQAVLADPESKTWEIAERADSEDAYRAYLNAYPQGKFTTAAEIALGRLKKHADSVSAARVAVSSGGPTSQPLGQTREDIGPAGKSFRDCDRCPEMVVLPAASYEMGASPTDMDKLTQETPQHWISISKPLAMSRTEVTREQFSQFATETGLKVEGGCWVFEDGKSEQRADRNWTQPGYLQSDSHPVTCVSWNDAVAYTKWLAEKTGKSYRLPTEAEWEFAARSGTTTARFWGDDPERACQYGNVADQKTKAQISHAANWVIHGCSDGHPYTSPRSTFRQNSYGLFDMLGNVWEWVEDCWNDSYRNAPVDGSAWLTGACGQRVARGGAWNSPPKSVRASTRNRNVNSYRDYSFGFRVVRGAG